MLLDLITALAAGFAGGVIAAEFIPWLRRRLPASQQPGTPNMTDNENSTLFIVMNEDRDIDSGPTLEQAAGRLDQSHVGNLLRAVKLTVHIAPPTVEDVGKVIVPDAAGTVTRLEIERKRP
jgi:hypothetical protein